MTERPTEVRLTDIFSDDPERQRVAEECAQKFNGLVKIGFAPNNRELLQKKFKAMQQAFGHPKRDIQKDEPTHSPWPDDNTLLYAAASKVGREQSKQLPNQFNNKPLLISPWNPRFS